MPRRRHGSHSPAEWSESFAWYEMAGGYTLFDVEKYEDLGESEVEEALPGISMIVG
ncbi:hypothetical protein [Solemya velesiana gill symbiont]|uniref:hypothetical protein n=1 Tax=Solemya velesiana gill symbiont TaxID=1918948 RepID=UPI00155FA74D|nr:hypothetical protein [Solemya velesiana gill symbiont]